MNCDQALKQLNARVDGELAAEDAADLDAHLRGCAECRTTVEWLEASDAELRRESAPRREAGSRLAERVVAALRESQHAAATIGSPVAPSVAPASNVAWRSALVGLAAGFLLAIALFRPWRAAIDVPATQLAIEPVAHLAVASGPVEVKALSHPEFFQCPTFGPIGRDSIIRTGPAAQCELILEAGNAVRLDCNTEVTLHESKKVEVNRGRLWWDGKEKFTNCTIESGGGTIVPNAEAEVSVACQPNGVRLVVAAGTVNVKTAEAAMDVGAGKSVRIVDGKLDAESEWCDPLLETSWVNRVLALQSSDHPEFVERVNQLLANVGAAKLSLMYEDELRELGDDGVPPLLAYLESTRDAPATAQRVAAARIVSDVAAAERIADLIGLLTDANGEVRLHAARGLERLTGRNQGWDAESWRTQSWGSCEGAYQKWQDWWVENRDRFPTARREIPTPTSAPF
jgi:hypothetical protein